MNPGTSSPQRDCGYVSRVPMRGPAGVPRAKSYPVVLRGSETPAGVMQRRPNPTVIAPGSTSFRGINREWRIVP